MIKSNVAKPETPIELNVTTIYFNSIEIEWKTGGVSDILYYIVKYRQYENNLNEIVTNDYIDLSREIVDQDSAETNENGFISINTTNTKLKVGTNLRPYTFYEFKVAAVNQLGHSQDTEPIKIRTAATSMLFFYLKKLVLENKILKNYFFLKNQVM